LELITWSCPKDGLGWGNIVEEESDDHRRKFEVEFGGDEEKFYKYWQQAFRWTCCGTDAGMDWGCDHHGSGSKPCTCDFCRFVYTIVPRAWLRGADSIFQDGEVPTSEDLQRAIRVADGPQPAPWPGPSFLPSRFGRDGGEWAYHDGFGHVMIINYYKVEKDFIGWSICGFFFLW
jgi:hypothetical protein